MVLSADGTNKIMALQGRNVEMCVGIPQTDVTLTGATDTWNIPDTMEGVFPRRCVSLTPTGLDIDIYEDGILVDDLGVEFDVDPKSDTYMQMTTDESISGVITADFVELFKPYLATGLKADAKQDTKQYELLNDDVKYTTYGAKSVTIAPSYLIGDLESSKRLLFIAYNGLEDVADDVEVLQMTSDPLEIFAYINLHRGKDKLGYDIQVGRLYFPNCYAVAKSLIDVTAGDNAKFAMDITVETDPLMVLPVI
jgi:hypothetical protein